jgi:tRNA-uridine 2-sulfurtransferase
MPKVVVGLSGGVDSSVAAYLLKSQGYDVISVFMRNWHDASATLETECPWIDDSQDAMLVAQSLDIPFQVIDFSVEYQKRIVDYMFSEYAKGRTPNPDVLCNREIKFDVFLQTAKRLGADFVATGHYCRKQTTEENGTTQHHLLAGLDANKDQSYFLCQISQAQLAMAMFPIGHLQKSEVRKIAEEQGLVTANKKDSQGLCFVGKIKLPTFLQQQLKTKKGAVVEIPADSSIFHKNTAQVEELAKPYAFQASLGKVIGEHQGAHFYTVGQRKGLSIGGTKEPLFVLHTDTQENIVYVGEGEHHAGLYRIALQIEEPHFMDGTSTMAVGESLPFDVRIRYRQALEQAQLMRTEAGYFLLFEKPQRGIASGQFAAWYKNDELIGSAVIS